MTPSSKTGSGCAMHTGREVPPPAPLQPIFIGGCPRSGTTMLGSILSSAPETICTPESQFLTPLLHASAHSAEALESAHGHLIDSFRYRLWQVGPPPPLPSDVPPALALQRFITELAGRVSAAHGRPTPRFWIDHTPANIHRAQHLRRVFPNARFLHIVRDGRAVAASLRQVTWGTQTPKKQAWAWQHELAAGLAMETRYGAEVVRRVHYEDIVSRPADTLPALFEWCGLPWTEDALAGGSFRAMPAYTRAQHRLVGRPPQAKRVDAWKEELSPRHVELFEYFAFTPLTMLGYPPLNSAPTPPTTGERLALELFETLIQARLRVRDRLRRRRTGRR